MPSSSERSAAHVFISMLGSVVAAPPTSPSPESKAKTFLLRGRPFTHVRLEGTVVAALTAAGSDNGKCSFVLDDGTGTITITVGKNCHLDCTSVVRGATFTIVGRFKSARKLAAMIVFPLSLKDTPTRQALWTLRVCDAWRATSAEDLAMAN